MVEVLGGEHEAAAVLREAESDNYSERELQQNVDMTALDALCGGKLLCKA